MNARRIAWQSGDMRLIVEDGKVVDVERRFEDSLGAEFWRSAPNWPADELAQALIDSQTLIRDTITIDELNQRASLQEQLDSILSKVEAQQTWMDNRSTKGKKAKSETAAFEKEARAWTDAVVATLREGEDIGLGESLRHYVADEYMRCARWATDQRLLQWTDDAAHVTLPDGPAASATTRASTDARFPPVLLLVAVVALFIIITAIFNGC